MKPSTLAEQIQQAQREVNSWPPEIRASVRLEGTNSLLSKMSGQRLGDATAQTQKASAKKK